MPPTQTQQLVLLGQTVRVIREARGISQQELADEVGITQAYLSKLELGQQLASAAVTAALARELAVPVGAITLNVAKLADQLAEAQGHE